MTDNDFKKKIIANISEMNGQRCRYSFFANYIVNSISSHANLKVDIKLKSKFVIRFNVDLIFYMVTFYLLII